MRKILLDSNFLVLPFQFNVELFDEFDRLLGGSYEVYTLERTYNEALSLEDGKYKELVAKLVDVKNIEKIETEAKVPVDRQVIEFGQKGFIVCTNDKEIKKELDLENLPFIYLRQKNHLEVKNLRKVG
ncbi:MAG: hypothetical protein MUP58_02355 [Candidatus Nanohaloarchaeota archaeon QJJ-9]|nr:hypothetical protein [Candidatus Nanohaloarchaeota archaeon QJJ-9]